MLKQSTMLSLFLWLATFDIFSIWLLMLMYLTGIDVMFLVNINFIVMTLFLGVYFFLKRSLGFLTLAFGFVAIFSVMKLLYAWLLNYPLELKHFFSYSIGSVMPLLALSFVGTMRELSPEVFHQLIRRFAVRYSLIAISGILVYALFYFTGRIAYFGLGTNVHYVFPFILSGIKSGFLLFLVILISGKRSVLLNFLAQIAVFNSATLKRNPGVFAFVFAFCVAGVVYLYTQTTLLSRFQVFVEMDISDPLFLRLAFSGRFEELIGIYNYFISNPYDLLFGAPPGAYYNWVVDFSDYEATKNYSHITIFCYIFRYGLIFTTVFYSTMLYYVFRHWSPRSPYFLVFIGVFASSMFGANLIIDPTAWFFIGAMLLMSEHQKRGNV
jgi:hypothetical protein